MNYSNIRIAGKIYTIPSFSPKTTEKVIKSLRGFEVQELKDIPKGNQILINTIATAISGSSILSQFHAFFIRRRLINQANIEDLIEVTGKVIEMIPASEYYHISELINRLQKLITK
nr:MAG TPA: hypothetical protein [Caudoviricetes sp.]